MELINFLNPEPQKILNDDGIVILYENFIENTSVEDLIEEIKWRQNEIKMFGKVHLEPRLMSFQGEKDVNYSYSGIKLTTNPFSKLVLEIKNKIELELPYKFNSALLNYYRDGNDHMSYHADDEKELGLNPTIASISFGETRKFVLKHRFNSKNKIEINLHDKSLLIMTGELQHYWLHKVNKKTASHQPRVNITFRNIVTKLS